MGHARFVRLELLAKTGFPRRLSPVLSLYRPTVSPHSASKVRDTMSTEAFAGPRLAGTTGGGVAEDTAAANALVKEQSWWVTPLINEVSKVIVGQRHLLDQLLIGILCNGHILIEGVPGLAKTLTVSSLARAINAAFSRVQFTPDLLPADLVGTLVYNPQ